MEEERQGYKQSLVMKHGIKIVPVGMARPGGIATKFKIRVLKWSSQKNEFIEVKGKRSATYPAEPTKVNAKDADGNAILDKKGKPQKVTQPSVWEKIDEIYDYYYNKLKTAA